ncbi:L-threonine dehydratase catabolic TdcB [Raoultella planticola]|uniref:L-threonine dehydratase catabolic TdcB n=1 Tax=Raoultella planticola TaxID=575 RepID=A0A485AR74_RAOPL|nr:L-threonine dehydratase catabolic TdcB [Raoultella planticola]
MHITYDLPVAIDDILEAKKRLAGKIYKTGMPRSNYFSERCKGEIFLKFENMQRTGSFKIRGAFNKLSSLSEAESVRAWWHVPPATMRKGFALLRHAGNRRQSGDAKRSAEIQGRRHL